MASDLIIKKTLMQLVIRKASQADAEYIALLARITFREAFGHIWNPKTLNNYLNSTFPVNKIRSSLAKENNIFWIAFADELPVGYLKIKKHSPVEVISDNSPVQLQKIYVLNDYTGHKIGEQLQEKGFEAARELQKKTMWLAVWKGNEKAIRFYENHGFRIHAPHKYDFEDMSFDFVIMIKDFPL